MKLAVTVDPESGIHIEKVTRFMREMAKKFPTQIRICEVPSELYQSYQDAETARAIVQTALCELFQNSVDPV